MLNRVFLIGRLGKDPVLKHFNGGGCVAEFTLATDDSYKDKEGNKVEQTDWHTIKVNGKLAEVAEKYLKKGDLVHVEGKIKTRTYDDKDGNKKYITEIVTASFKMLGGKGGQGASSAAEEREEPDNNSQSAGSSSPADDDLPF